MSGITITITHDGYDFKVPGPDGREATTYYADDRQDALDTARHQYGQDIVVRFKKVLEHPEGA